MVTKADGLWSYISQNFGCVIRRAAGLISIYSPWWPPRYQKGPSGRLGIEIRRSARI
jgi:hypothetical protein